MTTSAPWQPLARHLADRLTADDVLHDDAWRAAVEDTPRHRFVPVFHIQQPDLTWTTTGEGDDGWLEAVYRDQPLVTTLAADAGGQVAASSSTKPGLMIRMLEALDIHDGHRVLEIGTGTGHNAALLCHRLGDRNVFSVDIDPSLVTSARQRLAALGHAPVLRATDGAHGLPEHGPYDRIIATCSVPNVPWAWAEQLRPGGLLLVDLKRTSHAGNLALLKRYPDRLEGRFLPRWAGFMPIRNPAAAGGRMPRIELDTGVRSTTTLAPEPWNNLIPWFLAQARLPAGVTSGYRGPDREWTQLTAPDGSWCTVRREPDQQGRREVRSAGPTAIWDHVENACETWERLGRPRWDRLGLTVQPTRAHVVWLDEPDSAASWKLPGRDGG